MENINVNSKYKDGKIYRITDLGYNDVYIGSTVKPLSDRMIGHLGNYKKYKKGNLSRLCSSFILFDKYGDDVKIELIENYPCESKQDLLQREGYHIKLEQCINKYIAGRTKTEYYIDNKEQMNIKGHQNYLNNKEAYLQRSRTRNKECKEEIQAYNKKYQQENATKLKEKKKLYYEANKDEINARKKEYYEKNKNIILEQQKVRRDEQRELINAKAREQTQCKVCNLFMCRSSIGRHMKLKHNNTV